MRPLPSNPGRNQPCPCGSREKYKRCCGRDGVPATSGQQTLSVGEQLQQLAREIQAGRAAMHLATLRQLARQHPRNALAHYLLGHAAHAAGDIAAAADAMAKAIALGLDDPAADFHLARARLALGDVAAAERAFRAALNKRPGFAEARLGLANCALAGGKHDVALTHYQALYDSGQRAPELIHNLVQAALKAGRWSSDEGVEFLATQAGDSALAHALRANLLEAAHRLDEAEAAAERARALDPRNVAAGLVLARIAARRKNYPRVIELTEDRPDADLAERADALCQRGRAFEQLHRYDEALATFAQAKALERRIAPHAFDAAAFRDTLDRLRERVLAAPAVAAAAGAAPVFIVGFYRCGSSLLEQMLSMHPALLACGESPALAAIEARLERNATDGPALRDEYLAALTGSVGDRARTPIDKQLNNQLRLPLIHWLFPNARILQVLRHPLDSMLSSFSHQFEDHSPWSTALPDMAAYYRAAWAHVETCRAALPPTTYRTIRYEDLVADPTDTLRGVTDFLGIDWDPEMLRFHASERIVRTASYAQVTEPVHQAACYKYHAYLPHLDPAFLAEVTPIAHAMGYAI